ncbi:MAG: T9SS type A sorting domain-containing protein, partial [Bacteroidota bacterium]
GIGKNFMRIKRITGIGFACLILCISSWGSVHAQDTLRVMQYNILRYGTTGINCTPTGVTARNLWFTTIMEATMPDIFGVNEVGPSDGPTSPQNNILINILQPLNPDYRAATITFNGSQDIANQLYYNSAKIGLAKQATVTQSFRNIDYYKLYYKGPGLSSGDTTFVEVVLAHFAASNQTQAGNQAEAIMNYLGNQNRPGNFIVMGDFNQNSSNTGPMQEMLAHANLDIRMRDPINLSGTWSNNNSADHAWSQSTRNSGGSDCGSGGGLDDRFDLIMHSNAVLNNDDGISVAPNSYWVFGNPNAPNPSVSSTITNALIPMSDHYPVMLDLVVDRVVAQDPQVTAQVQMELRTHPVSEVLDLQIEVPGGRAGSYALELFDLRGQAVQQWLPVLEAGVHTLRKDVSALAPGIYFLRLQAEGETPITKKLVVR